MARTFHRDPYEVSPMIENEPAADELPFEPRTMIRAVTRQWKSIALLAAGALLVGGALARRLAPDRYAAELVLLHAPVQELGTQEPSLESRKEMVKVLPNLEEVVHRLGLDVPATRLDRACEVNVERDSGLLSIRAEWPDASLAARMANALGDVFLAQQTRVRKEAMARMIVDLEREQARAREEMTAAMDALGSYRQQHGVLNLDEQIRSTLLEVSTLETQLGETTIKRQNMSRQRANLKEAVQRVSQTLADGAVAPATGSSATEQANRLSRLRARIEEDRKARERRTDAEMTGATVARLRRLLDQGLVSRLEVQKAEADAARAQEVARETPETAQWGKQAEDLEKSLSSTASETAPTALGSELALQSFQLEVEALSVDERLKYLVGALHQARAKLAGYPALERAIADLDARRTRAQHQLDALADPLSRARRARESDAPDFVVVSRATPPLQPAGRRQLVAAGGLGGGLLVLWLVALAARAIRFREVRSARELEFDTRLPVLGRLPRAASGDGADDIERMRGRLGGVARLAAAIPESGGAGGPVVLIAGPVSAEARQEALDAVLAHFLLDGTRVAWLSLTDPPPRAAGPPARPRQPTLNEYLRDDSHGADLMLACHEVDGVARIGGPLASSPCLKGGARLRELVRRAAAEFELVVVVGGPELGTFGERALLRECDLVVLLARAEDTTRAEARRLSRMLADSGARRAGWLLLDEHPDYADLDAERSW